MNRSLYAGLITGTSMDGVDAALVDVDPHGVPHLVRGLTFPLPPALAERLQSLVTGAPVTLDALCEADAWLGEVLAEATLALLSAAGVRAGEVAAVGSHGQTVHHRPTTRHPGTLQIGDPNVIAERTGLTVVADLRRRDMAAGGQGAPLLPVLHHRLLGDVSESRVVLNLGGIANVTLLPAGSAAPTAGFDTGPANTLLDGWIQRCRALPFDDGGRWAGTGSADEALLAQMLEEPYFALPPPKSTGRELFNATWLDAHLSRAASRPRDEDVQATLLALTARSVAEAIDAHAPSAGRVIVAGGGVHNTALMAALRARLAMPVDPASVHGVDADHLEAMAFAWLAWARLEEHELVPNAVTGASHAVVLGALYPGSPRA